LLVIYQRLEPGTSSLSGIDGRAPCYPAFSQAVRLHEWRRDGVNRPSRIDSVEVVYLNAIRTSLSSPSVRLVAVDDGIQANDEGKPRTKTKSRL
jgi:hypothetical protein